MCVSYINYSGPNLLPFGEFHHFEDQIYTTHECRTKEFFVCGWSKRPKFGKTLICQQLFPINSVIKKSVALFSTHENAGQSLAVKLGGNYAWLIIKMYYII